MRLCYGLTLSSKYEQAVKLINTLNVNNNQIVIFVDLKSEDLYQKLYEKYNKEKYIYFIKDRFDVQWGSITQSASVVSLLKNTLQFDYDYFTMMSESCLPLYSDKEIKNFLERHKGTEFIDCRFDWTKRCRLYLSHKKPYNAWQRKHRNIIAFRDVFIDTFFGWIFGKNKRFKSHKVPTSLLWWTTTKKCTQYIVETIEKENLLEEYKNTLMNDEHIFAEVILKSPFYDSLFLKGKRGGALLYCDWYVINAPKLLTMKDYEKLYNPKYPCLYARKFDLKTEPEVIEKIYKNRNNPNFKCPF